MENHILKGEKYLLGVLGAIVLLQVVTNISDSIPLIFSLPRLSFLFVLFYFLLNGHLWSKWLLLAYLFSVGIGGVGAGFLLIRLRNVLPENLTMGIVAIIIGALYLLSIVAFFFPKEIKHYIKEKSINRNKISIRTHVSHILLYIGIATIICFETTLIPAAAQNVLLNTSLPKRILQIIFFLPVKVPYYAIPGLIVIFIGRLIEKETQGEKS